jgi:hypothetical protein
MPAGGKTRDASTTLEPAPSVSLGTNLPVHQALISAKSFTSAQTKQRSRAKLKFRSENPILIIGFDAEWVTEPPEPPDEEGDELEGDGDNDRILPDQIPRNRILSYQYACRYGDREWSGIIYTSAGARLRHSERTDAQIAEYPERISGSTSCLSPPSSTVSATSISPGGRSTSALLLIGPAPTCRRWRILHQSSGSSMECRTPM